MIALKKELPPFFHGSDGYRLPRDFSVISFIFFLQQAVEGSVKSAPRKTCRGIDKLLFRARFPIAAPSRSHLVASASSPAVHNSDAPEKVDLFLPPRFFLTGEFQVLHRTDVERRRPSLTSHPLQPPVSLSGRNPPPSSRKERILP